MTEEPAPRCGAASWVIQNSASRFVVRVRFSLAESIPARPFGSARPHWNAALLTSTSRRPNSSTVRVTSERSEERRVGKEWRTEGREQERKKDRRSNVSG